MWRGRGQLSRPGILLTFHLATRGLGVTADGGFLSRALHQVRMAQPEAGRSETVRGSSVKVCRGGWQPDAYSSELP